MSIRTLRHAALLALLGICLAGFTGPRVGWSLGAKPVAEKGDGSPRAPLYHIINFVLLVAALGYILRKPLAEFFSVRSSSIQKSLEEARQALASSQIQLRGVEEKLRHLEAEIAAFKSSAESEMKAEGERLRQAAAEEAERILESARTQMAMALRGAKLELKSFAAQKSVEIAEDLIRRRLDEPTRQRLVSQFAATLHAKELKN